MSNTRKKVVDFIEGQTVLIGELAKRQGTTTLTAMVSEAVNDYSVVRSHATEQILDRLLTEHADVIDRLSRT